MEDIQRPPGKTTIDPEVLMTIARLNTLSVQGVNRLAPAPVSVSHLFQKGAYDGVLIDVENNVVSADLFVILNRDTNVREVSRSIQLQLARAISEMVGMEVGKINVHIEDIDFSVV